MIVTAFLHKFKFNSMKGLYCRAGASDAEPKFVIQETVGLCFYLSADRSVINFV